ncbi:neutral zinc metallopeptidase [Tessaracoccus sp. Z1128]
MTQEWHHEPPEPGMTPAMKVGVAALAVTVAAALTVAGFTVASRSWPSTDAAPAATSPSATVIASPAPLPGAAEWMLPDRSWAPLPPADPASPWAAAQRTALDDVRPATLIGCPPPGVAASREAWQAAVRSQWECLHAAWQPTLRQIGWPDAQPALEFFDGAGTASDCGYLEAPAFYCSTGEGTVHFGDGHFHMAQTWDLAVNEMVNHEYGHHLQHLAGITAVKISLDPSAEMERRAELQATCWSALMTIHNPAVPFNDVTLASWQARLDTMLVDGVHGSRDSMRHWGARGLYAETLGDCNTWVAAPELVS